MIEKYLKTEFITTIFELLVFQREHTQILLSSNVRYIGVGFDHCLIVHDYINNICSSFSFVYYVITCGRYIGS